MSNQFSGMEAFLARTTSPSKPLPKAIRTTAPMAESHPTAPALDPILSHTPSAPVTSTPAPTPTATPMLPAKPAETTVVIAEWFNGQYVATNTFTVSGPVDIMNKKPNGEGGGICKSSLDGIRFYPEEKRLEVYYGQLAHERGKSRASKLSPERRSEIARKASRAAKKAKSAMATIQAQPSESTEVALTKEVLEMVERIKAGIAPSSAPVPPSPSATPQALDLLTTPPAQSPPPVAQKKFAGLDEIFSYTPPLIGTPNPKIGE